MQLINEIVFINNLNDKDLRECCFQY